ncbi:acetylglutamate kinase [Ileibacterium valens]|uniref:Acetylglutamate kinase n=1 Tax=Ileibacterium valens TaxID=1862668 RepID=A0A1U7NHL4_9FIRM|nr:acetylglutamate kinase [Ileibacterium valens]OLU38300.1 acetylglutamate kinase [Erysipelotrichaceae bacterium NYU-BL-E8]OLU40625.1 acetylglutamate kinase [Erysipelotrichaceae bacterium NYU-BL-F16]OLU41397.1 acetylglutamate kinase [Ileibacterium valens]
MRPEERAAILIEGLPYIKEYAGKTVVVKYGGNAMIDEKLKQAVIEDVLLLHLVGIHVILVHGGGPDISRMLKETGRPTHFVKGLRYTDENVMEIVQMTLCGKINKDLAAMLDGKGIGLSGLDGNLFMAVPHTDQEGTDYGQVGDIVHVNPEIVFRLIEDGYIPVISSVARGAEDDRSYNINADLAASKIAAALKAKKMILLTDVKGLMRDPADESTLIESLKVSQVPALINEGVISGGMIPKVECCVEAVRQGVQSVSIQDGRIPHSILMELLSDAGIGTMFS